MVSQLNGQAIPRPACIAVGDMIWQAMDLDLAPARQPYSTLMADIVGVLTTEDLAPAQQGPPAYKRLSDRHQAVARYVAEGMSNTEISILTGYGTHTITILRGDKTFQELVGFYRANQEAQFADLRQHMAGLSIDAIVELRERIEANPEKFTPGQLMELVKLLADRTGHGPTETKQVNVTTNIAQRLETARKRVEAQYVDITPTEVS